MAVMIPKRPREFTPSSREGVMFDALKQLPDDYYVFHSFSYMRTNDNAVKEGEADFVIFHPQKGVIALEAKAGQVRYEEGQWLYSSGIAMRHGGPFKQASRNMHNLMDHIDDSGMSDIRRRCKFMSAVWFPSINEEQLTSINLPAEANPKMILTKEALDDPEPYLDRIYSVDTGRVTFTNLSENDTNRLIREVFCPEFNLFPAASLENDIRKVRFNRLLKEQVSILNFLSEQQTAVINGAAGTGKTVIAVEKAKRHASFGEKVLFLCFNNKLKDYLEKHIQEDLIDFYTIAGLACKLCDTSEPDYKALKDKLETMYFNGSFPYKHVIVDEGQDFGMENIEESDILEIIKAIITDGEDEGSTFYIFYDKLQLIQAEYMPSIIEDADCKLTLYKNCRNTANIATTSLRPLTERKPKLFEGCVKGVPAKIHYCSSNEAAIKRIDETIDALKTENCKSIVILTCRTKEKSILKDMVKDGKYKGKCMFTTCRKFKGLEADAIILVDVDGTTFNSDNVLIYYVGSSRARLNLDIITELSDNDCIDILQNRLNVNNIRNPKKELAKALNALPRKTE